MRDDSHRRRDFLAGLAGVTAAIAGRPVAHRSRVNAQRRGFSLESAQTAAAAAPAFMYVGSFTSAARGHGEGISVYRRDRASGTWVQIQVLKDLGGPVVSHHRSPGPVPLFGPWRRDSGDGVSDRPGDRPADAC